MLLEVGKLGKGLRTGFALEGTFARMSAQVDLKFKIKMHGIRN